jgi:hypothetical protein
MSKTMNLRRYGATIKCNHCKEKHNMYNNVARCPWCGYYDSVMLAKVPGIWVYPPTLLDIDTVKRLPYYEGD